MTSRTRFILRSLLIFLISIIAGAGLYSYIVLKASLPKRDEEVAVAKITQPVEITFDSLGIPQVWAKTETDAYFSLGWLHASDRMFQMELLRRIAQGRLSELLGPVALPYDIDSRRIGHYRLAQEALPKLSEKNRARLQAYADGVNAYEQESGSLPFEFHLLGIEFSEWTVYDCLTILSFQTWFSNALQNRDSWFLEVYKAKGAQTVGAIPAYYPSWGAPTVPQDQVGSLDIREQMRQELASAVLAGLDMPSGGSNCWVISPNKSVSGKALLASDPHLEIGRLPEFWYPLGLHIEADSSGILGISLPGIPFVVMGHNGYAAFAFTAGGIDVTEYYREQINPEDSLQYRHDSAWLSFTIIPETLLVHGSDSPFVEQIYHSMHGPVVYVDSAKHEAITQRWAGVDADFDKAVTSGLALRTVGSFEEFRGLVTSLGALDANWMYADTSGTIGYQLGTPIPIRRWTDSRAPLDGADPSYEWSGYYPLEQTPHASNPTTGWLASCNNIPARNLPYELPGNFTADRILRITALLDSASLVSVADCERFQMDRIDLALTMWKDTVAQLLREIRKTALADTVAKWNGETGLDSRPTAIIELFLSALKREVFSPLLGDTLARGASGHWLSRLFLDSPANSDDTVSLRLNVAAMAAISTADSLLGSQRWGDLNTLLIQHPFTRVPVVGSLLDLNKGPWPWPGSAGTLNASFVTPTDDGRFRTIVAPSWRFVVDLSDFDAATMVLPAGVSGNPMSPHFFDCFDFWRSGKRWQVPFQREKVFANCRQRLLLLPMKQGE